MEEAWAGKVGMVTIDKIQTTIRADKFNFFHDPEKYNSADTCVAQIPENVCTKDGILECLYIALSFPSYFGFNWDALFECLRDFSWIKERSIVIIHSNVKCIPDDILKIYLEVLNDAINSWEMNSLHNLYVIFNSINEQHIKSLCNENT